MGKGFSIYHYKCLNEFRISFKLSLLLSRQYRGIIIVIIIVVLRIYLSVEVIMFCFVVLVLSCRHDDLIQIAHHYVCIIITAD